MSNPDAREETGMMQVGDCPNCGYVVGEIDFPNTPICDECGEELDKATVAPESEVKNRV